MKKWVRGFDSWDVCDQVCSAALDKTKFAYKKVFEFSKIVVLLRAKFIKLINN